MVISKISPLLFITAIWALLTACNKDDPFGIIQEDLAPPNVSAGIDQSVSVLQDTVFFEVNSTSAQYLEYPKYKYSWTCLEKPVNAPNPKISAASGYQTYISGLKPGTYLFQIEVSNKKGTKKDQINVRVFEDTLSGKTIIFDDLSWNIKDERVFAGSPVSKNITASAKTNGIRTDLFFRKLWSMEIAYRDEASGVWVSAADFTATIYNFESIEIMKDKMPVEWREQNAKKVSLRIKFQ